MIAAVNGPAIGLGNDVACLADMRIAADTAIFGPPFKIGLVPGDGGSWILPRTIGHARAAELFFTGDTIDAATAVLGLVSRIVPAAALMESPCAGRQDRASAAGRAAHDQRMMRDGQSVSFDTIMEMSAALQSLAHLTEDHQKRLTRSSRSGRAITGKMSASFRRRGSAAPP
jgi:enoyl-CoA hydratase/carnithine racemase